MAAATALYHALDLLNKPILAGLMREQPLPEDVLMLIQVAAGDKEAQQRAAALTSEAPERIHEAAVLYLQHVLLAPGADHYRVLGVEFDAPQERLRRHLGWLMRWLHPDRTRSEWDSAFAERVLAAWDALKTRERRQRYDRILGHLPKRPEPQRARRQKIFLPTHRIPWIARRPDQPVARQRNLRRIVALVVIGTVAVTAWLVPAWAPRMPWQGSAQPQGEPGSSLATPVDRADEEGNLAGSVSGRER